MLFVWGGPRYSWCRLSRLCDRVGSSTRKSEWALAGCGGGLHLAAIAHCGSKGTSYGVNISCATERTAVSVPGETSPRTGPARSTATSTLPCRIVLMLVDR